jgi:hypothetical protein
MSYQPEPFLGDLEDLPEYLQRQLQLISAEFESGVDVVQLSELYEEPLKPRLGMLVLADGAIWDPGEGAGFYGFDGFWHFLGGTGQGGLLEQSGVAVSHTGDTNETTLKVVSIPAGVPGVNGSLISQALWSCTPDSLNAKTPRMRFGALGAAATHAGVEYEAVPFGSVASYRSFRQIFNRNSEISQVGAAAALTGGIGGSPAALVTSAVDTTAGSEIEFSAQLANAGEQITLEAYSIRWVLG